MNRWQQGSVITEDIIFFSIHVPAVTVSWISFAGNVRILRLFSAPTKSLNTSKFCKTFLFWPIDSRFTTYRSAPKAFQNIIDKYQEVSHFITENFKTSTWTSQMWGTLPSIRIIPAISLRLSGKVRTNFRRPK